ncbi:MAG: hypothetical protein IH840_17525 [Candidatus Heimdallarchaeota archaeon]|nr:hypothetical protein [Candidatus Heimdallarchaeota archaeon]
MAIYIAGNLEGERRTRGEITQTAILAEVTLRNRSKELVRKIEIQS